MALGAQNAGKSTLCRYLANASTQKVALLDLDCGQPLSGPPGFVSLRLLDGPFLAETSHENNFERRIYLGATTPSDAPDAYVAAAALLKAHWASHLTDTKLVVNACGWVTGLGAEITAGLISTDRAGRCGCGDDAFSRRPPLSNVIPSRIDCGSIICENRGAPAAARRVLRLAAYFSQKLNRRNGPARRERRVSGRDGPRRRRNRSRARHATRALCYSSGNGRLGARRRAPRRRRSHLSCGARWWPWLHLSMMCLY